MSAYSADAYNNFLQELKSIERSIQNDLKELKINAGNNVNTFNTENSIRKSLENYLNKLTKSQEEYTRNIKDIKFSVPEKEYNRRVNEMQDLKSNYNSLKSNYDSVLDVKYKYV